jgi:nitrogen fixation NifU-like protein
MVERRVDFIRELEDFTRQETGSAFGGKTHNRRLDPLYMGALARPDGYARLTGTCGDTMEIFLLFENEIVKEASFKTDGCGSSKVCGSFAAEMCLGKTPDEILDITGEAIREELGGLQEEEQHCADLAAETLQEALHDYMVKERSRKKEKPDAPKLDQDT